MLKRRQMCTAECAKILRRYNEMRLTSNNQRRRPSPTPKYRGSGLKRLRPWQCGMFEPYIGTCFLCDMFIKWKKLMICILHCFKISSVLTLHVGRPFVSRKPPQSESDVHFGSLVIT